jgi:hypothetical protein
MEKHFKEKFYNPRSAEGVPNWKELKQIRMLDEALSMNEAYVGLSPYGSVVGGYGNENSDIDVKVFFDSSLFKKGEKFDDLLRITQASSLYGGKEVHIYWHDIQNAIFTEPGFTDPADYGFRAANLYRLMTGEKIRAYRKKVADYVHQFPQDYEERFKRGVMKVLAPSDQASSEKYTERVPDVSTKDVSERFMKRRGLLEERLDRMLKNPEQEVEEDEEVLVGSNKN